MPVRVGAKIKPLNNQSFAIADATDIDGLATVATTGDYNDLINKPPSREEPQATTTSLGTTQLYENPVLATDNFVTEIPNVVNTLGLQNTLKHALGNEYGTNYNFNGVKVQYTPEYKSASRDVTNNFNSNLGTSLNFHAGEAISQELSTSQTDHSTATVRTIISYEENHGCYPFEDMSIAVSEFNTQSVVGTDYIAIVDLPHNIESYDVWDKCLIGFLSPETASQLLSDTVTHQYLIIVLGYEILN